MPVSAETPTSAISASWMTTQPPPRVPSLGRSAKRDEAGVVKALAADLVDETLRRRRVERQRHQSLAAAARARDRHVRDVHPGAAEQRPDPSDHAGNVVVAEEDKQRRQLHLELEPERTDEPVAVVVADRRAGDAHLVAVRSN